MHSIDVIDNATMYVLAQNGSCDSVELRKKDGEAPTSIPRNRTGNST